MDIKKLSIRLNEIYNLIDNNKIVADIGCDHGYLSVYLAKYKNAEVYAVDKNEKPLKKAERLAYENNLLNKVKLLNQDGLKDLTEIVDIVVIAGLGGDVISDILFNRNIKYKIGQRLIISPHSKLEIVRKNLLLNGFKIKKEKIVFEKGKYYIIIDAVFDNKTRKITYEKTILGNFKWINEKNAKDYAQNLIEKNKKILSNLKNTNNKDKIKEHTEIIEKIKKKLKGV